MRRETAELIRAAAIEYGRDLTVDDTYSGRGMYGKLTCAVVGNRTDIEVSILWAVLALGKASVEDPDDCPDVTEAMEDLEGLRWDSMGKSDSVCY